MLVSARTGKTKGIQNNQHGWDANRQHRNYKTNREKVMILKTNKNTQPHNYESLAPFVNKQKITFTTRP
jgi:hypothetical protein